MGLWRGRALGGGASGRRGLWAGRRGLWAGRLQEAGLQEEGSGEAGAAGRSFRWRVLRLGTWISSEPLLRGGQWWGAGGGVGGDKQGKGRDMLQSAVVLSTSLTRPCPSVDSE